MVAQGTDTCEAVQTNAAAVGVSNVACMHASKYVLMYRLCNIYFICYVCSHIHMLNVGPSLLSLIL